MESALEFCRSILSGVSRSFALTIPMLDQELYKPVLIAYLQDRLLDTFEDEISDEDLTLTERKRAMDQVVELFNPAGNHAEEICTGLKEYIPLIPEGPLQQLTTNAILVREVYNTLDEKVKSSSFKWLQEMNYGMKKYLTSEIETFSDLDEYCYYVAGTVGGFLTDTVLLKRRFNRETALELLNNCNDVGLFLQKINLVRDIRKDIIMRRKNFWPLKSLGLTDHEQLLDPDNRKIAMESLHRMLEDIQCHIDGLVSYLEALPKDLSGYRRFLCVNNALGLATIERLRNNPAVFYSQKDVKVSKKEFIRIIATPEKAFYDKAAYRQQV
jgi:farnesyl-diphosphate farnesyltransferase